MKILLIHQYFLEKEDSGGSRFNELTRMWAKQGIDVTVVAGMVHYSKSKKLDRYKGKWIYKDEYSKDITVWRCHVSESYNKNFIGRLWGYFSFVLSSLSATIFTIRGKFDVIIVTSPPLFVGITGLVTAKIKRIPFLFEVRDLWPESAIETGVLKNSFLIRISYFLEKTFYNHAKGIIALTPAFKKIIIEKKNQTTEKVIMLPNAADFSIPDKLNIEFNREQYREQLGWNGKTVIIYVGAHGIANHLQQLFEPAIALEDNSVLFVLVGDGMEKQKLINEAKNKNITNIEFIDPVQKSEIFKYIISADIGASILKKTDVFKTVYSNKSFDYMACRKPILMAIDGISRKLVEDAKCGVYVEPENTTDYVKCIKQYLANPDKIISDGENGYQFAKSNFDRTTISKKYLKFIAQSKVSNKRQ